MNKERVFVKTIRKDLAYEEALRLGKQQPRPQKWCYFWDYMPSKKGYEEYTETMKVGIYRTLQPMFQGERRNNG